MSREPGRVAGSTGVDRQPGRATHASAGPPGAPVAVDGAVDRRAMDRLFGLYLLASGVALALPGRPGNWPLLALLHLAGAGLALGPAAVRA